MRSRFADPDQLIYRLVSPIAEAHTDRYIPSMASKPRAKSGAAAPTYQLKIVLKWSRPSIWRRVVVRADLSLHRLHDVIQIAMGWTDSHPHQFMVGSGRTPICYGMRSSDGDGMGDTLDETRYAVWDLAPKPKGKFVYEYDLSLIHI